MFCRPASFFDAGKLGVVWHHLNAAKKSDCSADSSCGTDYEIVREIFG